MDARPVGRDAADVGIIRHAGKGAGTMSWKKRLVAAVVCGVSIAGGAGTARAGEVIGPPGSVEHPGESKDVTHANSICMFSGLNDFVEGPKDFHVQSYGQDVRLYGADPREGHHPGDECRGGSNPYRP